MHMRTTVTRDLPAVLMVRLCALALLALFLFWPVRPAAAQGCATTVDVASNADSGPGALRQALADVCPDGSITFDTLTAGGPATITLASTLEISTNVTLSGPGANLLTVSGNGAVRVVQVNAMTAVTLTDLTIAGGYLPESNTTIVAGAGILNHGVLTLDHCSLAGNTDESWNDAVMNFGGAGIGNTGKLYVTNCLFINNSEINSSGAAIYNTGTLDVASSTFTGNAAPMYGGAIFNDGTLVVGNSTFTGNSANIKGGAIYNNSGPLTIANATVVANTSTGKGAGGGIYRAGGNATVGNSIVTGNTGGDIDGCNATTCSFTSVFDNMTLLLSPLQDNGGATWTMALPANSPVIDAGDNAICAAAPVAGVDQRGVTRPQGATCDVGAYEAPVCQSTIVVQNLNDSGAGSLRLALWDVCAGGTVSFAPALTAGGPVTLTAASVLEIPSNASITGPGASLLTISGGGATRVFMIPAGVTASMSGLTIAGGSITGSTSYGVSGAGILSDGNLTLSAVMVTGNTVNYCTGPAYDLVCGVGGGILNGGALTVTNSTFNQNNAAGGNSGGGAIYSSGALVVANSTFAGNTTGGWGGAIDVNSGSANVVNTTISNNYAVAHGGGVYGNSGATTNVVNAVVANNSMASLKGPTVANDIWGSVTTANLVQGDVPLGPLQNNGGPTPTMALPYNSAANYAGDNAVCAAAPVNGLDQRGVARPQGVQCDAGAYEATGFVCPQVYPVQNLADSGVGSLRDALTAVCPGGAISFSSSLTAAGPATITLASTLFVTQNLTIAGPGSNLLILNGNNASGVLQVSGGLTVTVAGVTITGGRASQGAAIYSSGNLTVENSALNGNTATQAGGAIYAGGAALAVLNSTVTDNVAADMGGAIYAAAGSVAAIANSTLSNNYVGLNSTLDGQVRGGAIYNLGILQVDGSTFSNNIVTACTVERCEEGDYDSGEPSGGAIYNSGGLTMTNSTLSSNSAWPGYRAYGGGIFNNSGSIMTIDSATFDANAAMGNSDGNHSGFGGGFYNAGTATLSNSTFTDSADQFNGGGWDNGGSCTGCQILSAGVLARPALIMMNASIVGDSENDPTDAIVHNGAGAILHLYNSLIAHGACLNEGIIAANRYNLMEDGSCSANGVNLRTGDPKLGPLQNNGGPTSTRALLPGSPAIDGGDPATCPSKDQRGAIRPRGTGCDIGPYEGDYAFMPLVGR